MQSNRWPFRSVNDQSSDIYDVSCCRVTKLIQISLSTLSLSLSFPFGFANGRSDIQFIIFVCNLCAGLIKALSIVAHIIVGKLDENLFPRSRDDVQCLYTATHTPLPFLAKCKHGLNWSVVVDDAPHDIEWIGISFVIVYFCARKTIFHSIHQSTVVNHCGDELHISPLAIHIHRPRWYRNRCPVHCCP